ncbi:hemolysin III family protein [candidate division CSSED10-310 bacterium]|uniref:Hemolysin III family protein n=1 Tax=candidate division CSSED10-310 bacterium TaxID=2855610 RepID=A0ABV6Z100_UNCC1
MYKGERFNSISHLTGAVAGLLGLVILVVFAVRQAEPLKILSVSIYGTTLLFLYIVSTLYHSMRGKAKKALRRLDYIAIYLLIAGSYTPFILVSLRETWGWPGFGIIWGLAVFGIILEILTHEGPRFLPVVIYLMMGWSMLLALNPLLRVLTVTGFTWLLIGGLFYTVGVIFFSLSRWVRHSHGIWHLFVLAGSITHYFTILYYVV